MSNIIKYYRGLKLKKKWAKLLAIILLVTTIMSFSYVLFILFNNFPILTTLGKQMTFSIIIGIISIVLLYANKSIRKVIQ